VVGAGRQVDGPPPVTGVLETCLYVDDLDRARRFYEDIIGLRPVMEIGHMVSYSTGNNGVLILFRRGSMVEPVVQPYGTIPAHDGAGPLHFCLSIPADRLDQWRDWLRLNDVAVISEVDWPDNPGRSIYFHDPDGHVMELATPGLWGIGA